MPIARISWGRSGSGRWSRASGPKRSGSGYTLGRNNVVDIEITPARDHDAPVLRLDERWRGMGLIVDLGYVSLVGVPGPSSYHWCVTLLPRDAATPELIQKLYRARWEIELDNKRDKRGARLDQIRAQKPASALVLVYASLIRTMLANHLVYIDLRDRPPTRAPPHGMAVALALNVCSSTIVAALELDDPRLWHRACRAIRPRGHDPNWRRRPSVLDQLRGIRAPPGRPRRARQRDCPPSALPYRQHSEPIL